MKAAVLALAALSPAMAATIQVTVGANGNLAYDPQFVSAAVNDYVVFTFSPKNHTVTQSTFAAPCVPADGGVNSGFRPVTDPTSTAQQFQFQVLDTNPKWFFCEQTGHCGKGMVFAINPPADPSPNSFSAFQALAKQLNGTSTSSSTATTTSPPSTTTDTYTTPPPQSWTVTTAVVSSGASTWTSTYTSYVGSASPTFAATPQDHPVIVGFNGTLTYNPSSINASLGDTVTFQFHAKNHSVVQSSFSAPCQPLQDTTGKPGFNSGFMPVAQDATNFPTFQITVNDTAPIWVYCGQTSPVDHCGSGMVFAVNAVESGANTFEAFQALAKRINGTSTTTGTSTSSTSTTTGTKNNAALANVRVHGAVLVLSLLGAVAYLL